MARHIADDEIRDTDTHYYEAPYASTDEAVSFQIINNLNASVEYNVHGTYEKDDFSDEVGLLDSTRSISGGSADTASLSEPLDKIRFEVTAQSVPSDGLFRIKKHVRG